MAGEVRSELTIRLEVRGGATQDSSLVPPSRVRASAEFVEGGGRASDTRSRIDNLERQERGRMFVHDVELKKQRQAESRLNSLGRSFRQQAFRGASAGFVSALALEALGTSQTVAGQLGNVAANVAGGLALGGPIGGVIAGLQAAVRGLEQLTVRNDDTLNKLREQIADVRRELAREVKDLDERFDDVARDLVEDVDKRRRLAGLDSERYQYRRTRFERVATMPN